MDWTGNKRERCKHSLPAPHAIHAQADLVLRQVLKLRSYSLLKAFLYLGIFVQEARPLPTLCGNWQSSRRGSGVRTASFISQMDLQNNGALSLHAKDFSLSSMFPPSCGLKNSFLKSSGRCNPLEHKSLCQLLGVRFQLSFDLAISLSWARMAISTSKPLTEQALRGIYFCPLADLLLIRKSFKYHLFMCLLVCVFVCEWFAKP